MKRLKGYQPGRALSGQDRAPYLRAALAYRRLHGHLPGGGYVVFYQGRACGWTLGIEGGTNGWLAGCVAVPNQVSEVLHVAVGGNYQDGAERWEALAP